MLIRQAALLVMAACAATWAHATGCCVAPMELETVPESATMETECPTCTGAEVDATPVPDAVRTFTLMVNALEEMHAQRLQPRAGVRSASGGKYDQATIDTDIRLILELWAGTVGTKSPAAVT